MNRYDQIERAHSQIDKAVNRLIAARKSLQDWKFTKFSDAQVSDQILRNLTASRECATTASEIVKELMNP